MRRMSLQKATGSWDGTLKNGKGIMKPAHAAEVPFSLGTRFEGQQGSNPEEMYGAALAAAARRLDDIYELHEKLRGARPHHGQRLRFFPDEVAPGYMLAGNPIRVKAAVVSGKDEARISRAGEATNDPWGFAHEMGHDFTFATGFWQYQNKSLEAWPNVFSIHALEALGLPIHDQAAGCTSTSTGSYLTTESWSPWTALCFLMQLKFDHGWELYERFFAAINTNHTMPNQGSGEKTAWYFVHDRFEEAAKADVTPTFAAWNVPHP